MGFFARLKQGINYFIVAPVCVTGRVIYNAGQTLYYIQNASNYFHISNHPASTVMTSVSVAGTMGSTLLRNTVPTYKQFAPYENQEGEPTPEERPLGWAGKITTGILQGSGIFYDLMSSVAGYFGTVLLSEAVATALNSDAHDAVWKEAIVQTGAILVTLSYLYSYSGFDYKYIKRNIRILSENVDERNFTFNRNVAKTLAASALNFYTYPSQAFFLTVPSLKAIPYAEKILTSTGINVLAGTAAVTTFLTVVTWLPSVYAAFANKPSASNADQPVEIPKTCARTCASTSIKIASYTMGTIDSAGGNGLGPGISVILTMNKVFKVNPYGWVIGLGAVCGLNAAAVNFLFSVIPGLRELLEAVSAKKAVQDIEADGPEIEGDDLEKQPLLSGQNSSHDPHANKESLVIEVIEEDTSSDAVPATPFNSPTTSTGFYSEEGSRMNITIFSSSTSSPTIERRQLGNSSTPTAVIPDKHRPESKRETPLQARAERWGQAIGQARTHPPSENLQAK